MTTDRDERLLKRLLETFKQEAQERIAGMASGLSQLAGAEIDALPSIVESLFREAHSLKAAAQSVGQKEISALCQAIESIFAAAKRREIDPRGSISADVQLATDAMEDLLATLESKPNPSLQARGLDIARGLGSALERARSGGSAPSPRPPPSAPPERDVRAVPATPPAPTQPATAGTATEPGPARPDAPAAQGPAATETIRLSAQQLDSVLRQAEEMLFEKLAARQLSSVLDEAIEANLHWRREWDRIRTFLARLRAQLERDRTADPTGELGQLMRFLEWNQGHMAMLESLFSRLGNTADSEARRLGLKVDSLLFDLKEILTVPCASMAPLFQRAVREVARDQRKDVSFDFQGGELEIDRRILQELKDPILHLLRNCVDHGIEPPEERVAAGKPREATVSLRIQLQEGDRAELVIADDGRGIATKKLVAAAAKIGVAAASTGELPEEELLSLVFQSGVSTAPIITDLSGRGLGLAIVREKVEGLGGSVAVASQPGLGTTFRLMVPLSLAAFRGTLVRVADRLYAFPSLRVDRVMRIRAEAVSTIENRSMLDIGGKSVPLVSLREILGLAEPADDRYGEAVVAGASGRQIAFEVDTVEEDREILLKSLGRCLQRVRNIQGATILAGGGVVPVLNVHDLLISAAKATGKARAVAPSPEPTTQIKRSILVAEDSITARGLLRSILEAAGYRVRTAVDGEEAWAALKLESFDAVVSDVEMPRMNGFDLTTRIRADKKLGDLPVLLVTALESREDRERGVSVGANAYILKGGFDQGMLLEALKRLV